MRDGTAARAQDLAVTDVRFGQGGRRCVFFTGYGERKHLRVRGLRAKIMFVPRREQTKIVRAHIVRFSVDAVRDGAVQYVYDLVKIVFVRYIGQLSVFRQLVKVLRSFQFGEVFGIINGRYVYMLHNRSKKVNIIGKIK